MVEFNVSFYFPVYCKDLDSSRSMGSRAFVETKISMNSHVADILLFKYCLSECPFEHCSFFVALSLSHEEVVHAIR